MSSVATIARAPLPMHHAMSEIPSISSNRAGWMSYAVDKFVARMHDSAGIEIPDIAAHYAGDPENKIDVAKTTMMRVTRDRLEKWELARTAYVARSGRRISFNAFVIAAVKAELDTMKN